MIIQLPAACLKKSASAEHAHEACGAACACLRICDSPLEGLSQIMLQESSRLTTLARLLVPAPPCSDRCPKGVTSFIHSVIERCTKSIQFYLHSISFLALTCQPCLSSCTAVCSAVLTRGPILYLYHCISLCVSVLYAMASVEHCSAPKSASKEVRSLTALLQELNDTFAAASDDTSNNTPHCDSEAIGARLCSVLLALLNKCISVERGALPASAAHHGRIFPVSAITITDGSSGSLNKVCPEQQ